MAQRHATIIFVRWLDAAADVDGWHEAGERHGLSELYGCGFLVSEDEEVLVIAALGKDVEPGLYRVVVRIPVGSITHRQYIKVDEPFP